MSSCASFIRLTSFKGGMEVQEEKTLEAIKNRACGFYYEQKPLNFSKIPGSPIAYWLSQKAINLFNGKLTSDYACTKQGFKTGDNNKFLRMWHEIPSYKFSVMNGKKWYPCNKGGDFRRWYGNLAYTVNWENNGFALCNFKDSKGKLLSRPQNISYNFHEGITWTYISSSLIALRYSPEYMMFESSGPMFFANDLGKMFDMLAYLNSKVAQYFLFALEPTLRYSEGTLLKLPYIDKDFPDITEKCQECISLSRTDWDSFETSWDFKKHPLLPIDSSTTPDGSAQDDSLVKASVLIADCYDRWAQECETRFNTLKANEEELNRIFIDIYGLQDELTPDVEDKDVTVRKADLERDIKSLVSYAVGCMFKALPTPAATGTPPSTRPSRPMQTTSSRFATTNISKTISSVVSSNSSRSSMVNQR